MNTIHPLARQGTTQRERLLKALIPENLKLDDRNLTDLLAFAGKYAKQIQFWSPDNVPDGDWIGFFEHDATPVLAIVAATDLEELRANYRSHELKYIQECKKEKQQEGKSQCENAAQYLPALVLDIFEVAKKILEVCQKLPDKSSVKTETQALVKEKLGITTDAKGQKNYDLPIGQLVRYHKSLGEVIEAYNPFFENTPCAEAWGLTQHDFLTCIDFKDSIGDQDREILWRLFLTFYKVLSLIVKKAEKAFNLALHGRTDHPPHIALFLAFLLLFRRYHQADMNGLVAKHLLYYYRDVLRLQERREIPDRVHVVFEIAQNLEDYRLQKGTLLQGGQDSRGLDRLYALMDEIVVNKAQLVEKQTIYFQKYVDKNDKSIPIVLPAADKKDGIKTLYPKGKELWHPLSGMEVYKDQYWKKTGINFSNYNDGFPKVKELIGKPGFIISSPELWLAKGGARSINIEGLPENILDNFNVELSTKEKAQTIIANGLTLEISLGIEKICRVSGNIMLLNDGSFSGELTIIKVKQNSLTQNALLGNQVSKMFQVKGNINNNNENSFSIENTAIVLNLKGTFSDEKITNIQGDLKIKEPITLTLPLTNIDFSNATINYNENTTPFENINISTEQHLNIKGSISAIGFIGDKDNRNHKIFLPSSFPDITPTKDDLHAPAEYPYLRFTLKEGIDYEAVKGVISKNSIKISTSNQNLKNLSIQLGSTQFPPTAEIPLVGSTIAQQTTLYVTAPELSVKNIIGVNLNSNDKNAPDWGKIDSSEIIQPSLKQNLDSIEFNTPIQHSITSPYAYSKKDIIIPKSAENQPITIYKIPPESISLSYSSESVIPQLYWVDHLGGYKEIETFFQNNDGQQKEVCYLVPQNNIPIFDAPLNAKDASADGNLRLGFENLKPGQSLSLLFHFAEGSGNPDHIAPDEIVWAYLRDNSWVRIPPQFIVIDETLGLRQTGIIRFQIPFDITNNNTIVMSQEGRRDLFWLQASATENPDENIFVDALPMLQGIHTQAVTAVFQNNDNDLLQLEKGLPVSTITQLRFRDSNVTKVEQPYVSFDGRLSEQGDLLAYFRRISERLRHRQRAVTIGDYERLTLEQFPKVAIAKCLSHTHDTDVCSPSNVTLAVVPYPERMIGNRKYYPIFNAGVLETIEQFLNRYNSYFVSGRGGGVVCCCEECGCNHEGHLTIRNAIFEPIRLQVCVKFRAGRDEFYYKKQLNEDLKRFLAPWANDSQVPLTFGVEIYKVEILRFLENLDYVDVIMGLKIKQFSSREAANTSEDLVAFVEIDIIKPFTSRSILTTYLDVLNEDNDNVLDHDIQVIEGQGCCADCDPKI